MAVNRVGSDKADFINCQVWNGQAENLVKYQGKGSLVGVVGSLRTDTYEVEGTKRYKTYVLVSTIEYLGTKKQENAQNIENTVQNVEEDPFEQMARELETDNDWLD